MSSELDNIVTVRRPISERIKLKIIVMGDSMVGKTSLLLSLKTNAFLEHEPPTLMEFYTTEVNYEHGKILLEITEVPCMDGYDKMRAQVYPKTNCIIICYAMNNPSSFANVINKWLPEVKEYCPSAVVLLVGTKLDLKESITSDTTTIISEESKLGLKLLKGKEIEGYIECSAKYNESVDKVFEEAVRIVFKKNDPKRGSCKQT